jgi:TolB-like protein
MKRCPECRRDYFDDTLSFCLEDGSPLVYGVSEDDPATAILDEFGVPPSGGSAESATRSFNHTTASEAEPQTVSDSSTERHSLSAHRAAKPHEEPKSKPGLDKRLLVAPLVLAVIVLGGFLGYRYFGSNTKQIESIAVMPFINGQRKCRRRISLGWNDRDADQEFVRLPGLDVKPRSAVFRYKGKDTDPQTIGKELNVQAMLSGRVAQRGDQIMLSLELVDVQKNSVIWTEQYQRKQSDIVSLQSEIARDVSTKLKAKLSGAEETKVTKAAAADPEAYQAYLKGRYYWNRRTALNIKKAIEEFKLATDRDPNYALAFVGLADCYAVLNEYAGTPTSETLPQARAFAERSLALDPQTG